MSEFVWVNPDAVLRTEICGEKPSCLLCKHLFLYRATSAPWCRKHPETYWTNKRACDVVCKHFDTMIPAQRKMRIKWWRGDNFPHD